MVVEEVQQLAGLVDALGELDLAVLDDASLHDITLQLHRLHSRLGLVASHALAAWEGRGVWASDQSRTSTGRLSRELNCSARTAKSTLRRARLLSSVPRTVAAVRRGTLSPDHIELLAGAQSAAPERFAADEAQLVEHCERLHYPDAQHVVAYWKLHADPDGSAADADRAAAAATAHASETLDGTVVIDATLDPIGGTIVLDELRRLADELRLADTRDGVVRTAGQRRAAALVEMAIRSSSMPAGSRRPKPLFTVLIGDESLAQLCELSAGRVVPSATVARFADVAVIETVLFDGPDTVVSVSRKRSFTGVLRRAIEVRDRHCQHPSGCDVPADRCDVDHIVPWPQSHRTDQGNGRLECPTHNRHADRHDTDATPQPVRLLTGLDALRARARWWCSYHDRTTDDADDEPEPLAG